MNELFSTDENVRLMGFFGACSHTQEQSLLMVKYNLPITIILLYILYSET
jgi:hypothetical protein